MHSIVFIAATTWYQITYLVFMTAKEEHK